MIYRMTLGTVFLVSLCLSVTSLAGEKPVSQDMQHNSAHAKDHGHNGHKLVEVSNFNAIPKLQLIVIPDEKMGWNLQVITENFSFTPENVNKTNVEGEGHAHLYIDDVKVTRLYGPWYYIRNLSPAAHSVRVSLNGNDHSDLALHGEPIAVTVTIQP